MPATLFAAIDAPVPVQQQTTAWSARPSATSRAAASLAHAQSGRSPSASAPCASTSWPRSRSSLTSASATPVSSSAATAIRIAQVSQGPAGARVAPRRPGVSSVAWTRTQLEPEVQAVGRELAAALPQGSRGPLRALDDRAMEFASQDEELRAALFRFVDVVPACRSLDDLARHLTGFLDEVERPAAADRRRDADGLDARRARGARRRGRGRRQAHGAPLHRRRDPARRARRAARAVARRRRVVGRPARRGDDDRRRGRPLRGSAARRRSTSSAASTRSSIRARCSTRDSSGADAAREPVGEGLRADAAAAPRRAGARAARRRRAAAPAAAPRARRAARTCTSTWRASTRARPSPTSSSGCSTRTSSRTGRRPASSSRPTCATRPSCSTGSSPGATELRPLEPADRAARQGRLLGPRDRRGAPARLEPAGVRGQGRQRPQLRAPDAQAARGAPGACAWRSPRTTCARSRTRSRPSRALGGGDRGPRAPGPARARRRPPGRARRRAATACARTARSATSSRAWPTSCGGCSRTRATRGSSRARPRACRSRSCWPRHELRAVRQRAAARAAPRAACATRCCRRCRELDAELPLSAPLMVGGERRDGRRARLDGPRQRRTASWRCAPLAAADDARLAVDAAVRAFAAWSRTPAARARRGARAAPPRCCASAAFASPRSPCASARSRGIRPTPTSARRSTSSSTTRARALELDGGPPLIQPPGERNELRHRPRGVTVGDLAVELPARDPARDDGRGARGREPRRPQARRAVAGLRGRGRARRCTRRACRTTRSSLRARRGRPRAPRWSRDPRVATIAFTGSVPSASTSSPPRPRRSGGRRAPDPARRRRAGRQELRDRRLRRRPRRGRPGDRPVGVRLRRPEVLGGVPRARARGDRRRSAGAPRGRGRGARRRAGGQLRDTVPPLIEAERAGAGAALRRARAGHGPDRRTRRGARRRTAGSAPRCVATDLPADSAVLREEIFGPLLAVQRVRDVDAGLRPRRRAPLRADRRPLRAQPAGPSSRCAAARRSETSTSTARSPAPSSDASRSAGTGSREPGRRPAAPATCSSSATRRWSARTPCATGSSCSPGELGPPKPVRMLSSWSPRPRPEVVSRYFELDAERDVDGVTALFTDEATVVDERETHRGSERDPRVARGAGVALRVHHRGRPQPRPPARIATSSRLA